MREEGSFWKGTTRSGFCITESASSQMLRLKAARLPCARGPLLQLGKMLPRWSRGHFVDRVGYAFRYDLDEPNGWGGVDNLLEAEYYYSR